MKLLLKIALVSLLATPCFARIADYTAWEIRPGGDNLNGGAFCSTATTVGGIDYSQQNSAQFTYSDLSIVTSTPAVVSSFSVPFTSACTGNLLSIIGGTGFTTGYYQITAVVSSSATLDRACGAEGSVSGSGRLGGAFAFPHNDWWKQIYLYNRVYMASGTYSLNSGIPVNSSFVPSSNNFPILKGYYQTREDTPVGDQRPFVNTYGNNWVFYFAWSLADIRIHSSSATTSTIQVADPTFLRNCKITNNSTTAGVAALGIYNGQGGTARLINSEFSSVNGAAISASNTNWFLTNCWVHDSTDVFMYQAGRIEAHDNLFTNIQKLIRPAHFTYYNNFIFTNNSVYGVGISTAINFNDSSRSDYSGMIVIQDNSFNGFDYGINIATTQFQMFSTGQKAYINRNNWYNIDVSTYNGSAVAGADDTYYNSDLSVEGVNNFTLNPAMANTRTTPFPGTNTIPYGSKGSLQLLWSSGTIVNEGGVYTGGKTNSIWID